MNKNDAQLWFADSPAPFGGTEPLFYDTAAFAWVQRIEENWEVIRDELAANIGVDKSLLSPYMDQTMMSRPGHWKTLGLMFWTLRSAENCRRFPKTWELLSTVPDLIAVSLNLLQPNTTIKPHVGNTNAIIRCHLGLVIPAPAPKCGFRVGAETRSWDEGRYLMFCDAHQHTAWNNTDGERYILVMDIMRPEFASQKLSVSARVLAAINFENACRNNATIRRLFHGPRKQRLGFSLFRLFYGFRLRCHALVSGLPGRR